MLTEEQRRQRMEGLGASDTPIHMGYSSFKTPYELFLEKRGLLNQEEEPETELQYWGNLLEPVILAHFEKVHGTQIQKKPPTVYHPEHKFIFANLDGYCPRNNWVIEAKNVSSFMRHKWDKALEDGIPFEYLVQIAKQVALKNAIGGWCAALIGGNEYMQFYYERDIELEKMIIKADIEFWHKVENNIAPEVQTINDCRLAYKDTLPDSSIIANHQVLEHYQRLLELKQQQRLLAEIEDRSKVRIMDYLREKEYLVNNDGEILVTWKPTKKGNRVFNIKGK